jgi:hypothetical protein
MNSLVRSSGGDVLQRFLDLETAAGRLTSIDAVGAKALIDTGVPAAVLAALDIPATNRDVMVALGSIMAAFPSAANKPDLDAYAAVLIDNLPDGLSRVVLQLAAKRLIRERKFLPAVSEILDAIDAAEQRIRRLPENLTAIASYVEPEEAIWLEKDRDYALWRKVEALRGYTAPIDVRGGWYFPKSLVERAREGQPAHVLDEFNIRPP